MSMQTNRGLLYRFLPFTAAARAKAARRVDEVS